MRKCVSALVSWFISCSPTQSLYPGRPRGGLTYSSRLVTFSNRCRPPVEALRVIPRIHSLWCAPPPRHPVVPNLSGYEDFLARPLATALWPRPSSSTPTLGMCKVPFGACSYRARTARHLRNRVPPPPLSPLEQPPRNTFTFRQRHNRTSSHQRA